MFHKFRNKKFIVKLTKIGSRNLMLESETFFDPFKSFSISSGQVSTHVKRCLLFVRSFVCLFHAFIFDIQIYKTQITQHAQAR